MLEELDRPRDLGVRLDGGVADAGYGHGAAFRKGSSERGLTRGVIRGMWPVGPEPQDFVCLVSWIRPIDGNHPPDPEH